MFVLFCELIIYPYFLAFEILIALLLLAEPERSLPVVANPLSSLELFTDSVPEAGLEYLLLPYLSYMGLYWSKFLSSGKIVSLIAFDSYLSS